MEVSLMCRLCLVAGMAVWLAGPLPAGAFIAYVSNERSNTVSVIDTDKWAVIKTIKVGQRPRGIEFTKDGKFVLVAVGDDDTIQMIDTATQQVADTLPSGPDPELFIQDKAGKILYVANENDNPVTVIDIERRARVGDVQVGVEPEGMAISPDGRFLINTSETTNMAHFIDTAARQIVANVLVDARPRFAEFKRDGSELWVSSEIGGTVAIIDPVKHTVTTKITSIFRACERKRSSQLGSVSLPTERPRSSNSGLPTVLPWSMPRVIRSPNNCWSASESGTWRLLQMKNSFWSRMAYRMMCPLSMLRRSR